MASSEMTAIQKNKEELPEQQQVSFRAYVGFAILFVINILSHIDRLSPSAMLSQIQAYFSITNAESGLIQTCFIAFITICSPVAGFLGDRYSRKWIIVASLSIWEAAVIASSFVPSHSFWLFLGVRGLVAVGHAGFRVVCPSLIADIFPVRLRTRMLMIFHLAMPIGVGLGYIICSSATNAFNDWRWGVRATTGLGLPALLLALVFLEEPQRGRQDVVGEDVVEAERANYLDDVKALLKNATYVTSCIGYAAVCFVMGALGWWVPTAIQHAQASRQNLNKTTELSPDDLRSGSFSLGIVVCAAGFVGVIIGSFGSMMLKKGSWCCRPLQTERSDALVCAASSLLGLPLVVVYMLLLNHHQIVSYMLLFLLITALCADSAIHVSLTLLSDAFRGSDDSPSGHLNGLRNAFYLANLFLAVSALFFAVSACTFSRDRQIFHEECGKGEKQQNSEDVQLSAKDATGSNVSDTSTVTTPNSASCK